MVLPGLEGTDRGAAQSARERLVEAARSSWSGRLIDTSRRNNLLFYRPLRGSTIEIDSGNPSLNKLLAGQSVLATTLLQDSQDRPNRVLNIARKAQENSEEKGLQTLYLGLGFAGWKAEDGGRDYRAPVFLLPLAFKRKGTDYSGVEVSLAAEPQVNPVLLHVLSTQYGVEIERESLLPAENEHGTELNFKHHEVEMETEMLEPYSERLGHFVRVVKNVPEFQTDASAVIGNFAFAKMAMVNDLTESAAALLDNQLVAAIAGDSDARADLCSSQVDVDPHCLDSHSPDTEFCVVDADSSQQCAIEGITSGQSAVVHGPPGTGKSQTITNLIATLVSQGKTVLFVAEKRAALEVVQKRLTRSQLGHLAIDLHGAELSPRKVMERVAETLNVVRHSKLPDCEGLHRRFEDRRARLNQHDALVNTVSPLTAMTLFAMQGKLLSLPSEAQCEVRWRGPELQKLSPNRRIEVVDQLRELSAFASLAMRNDASPWTGISFREGAAVQEALDTARHLAYEFLPALQKEIAVVAKSLSLAAPQDFKELDELLNLLRAVSNRLEMYVSDAYVEDLSPTIRQLERGASPFAAMWLSLVSKDYKMAVRRAVVLRQGAKASAPQMAKELRGVQDEAARWRSISNGRSLPSECGALKGLETRCKETRELLKKMEDLRGRQWPDSSFEQIAVEIEPFAKDQTTPFRLLKVTDLESKIEASGAGKFLQDLRRRQLDAAVWSKAFDWAWISSAIDEIAMQNPEVKGFVGETHSAYVADFKELDSDRLKVAIDRVRRAHAVRAIQAMNEHPDQEALIRAEAAKSRRHKPLREMFTDAREVLTAVCPCWMASPLSVSQLIARDARFDYVIFDEASQVLPEDAVPSIMRGNHMVVAGDNQQLPPTSFFAGGLDEDEDEEVSAAEGFESLLDMMLPFAKSFYLNWHYRSHDEALIAFSNHNIYKDRLVTFPGPGGQLAVSHILVDHVPAADGQEDSSAEEVRRVVELVIDHARNSPHRTLGVIAMGIKHAMRLEGALDQERKNHPEVAAFFDPESPERFFVKNLERVQGDERDSIIISVGYGKNRAGDLPLRFGPILSAGGRRRLNVAITRARETMTVVSSFSHLDIDASKVREGTGLEFLRNFLQYAASGGRLITLNEITSEPMNDFEVDVCTALEPRGMKLVPQVGCSQFRIDFGVCHPERPGQFVLAIECDGATYHSSATARDRDRLRQQMLEHLGWSFHRIWSTDWFLRREEEIERAWAAYQAALLPAEPARDIDSFRAVDPVGEVLFDDGIVRSQARRSSPRPPVPARNNIGEYSSAELRRLCDWVKSDGELRTHDEIAEEMFRALPFARRGARIEEALRRAIAATEKL